MRGEGDDRAGSGMSATPKFTLRKRTAWFEGDVAKRRAHDGSRPLCRDWRQGEPLVYVRAVLRRHKNPSFADLYMATVYKRRAVENATARAALAKAAA